MEHLSSETVELCTSHHNLQPQTTTPAGCALDICGVGWICSSGREALLVVVNYTGQNWPDPDVSKCCLQREGAQEKLKCKNKMIMHLTMKAIGLNSVQTF